MKIIYCHHANRDISKGYSADNDLTNLGKKDAKLVGKLFDIAKQKGTNIVAIYHGPTLRHKKTAQIINKKLNVPLVEEPRFDEYWSGTGEKWIDAQKRTREAILDIVRSHKETDVVVCVTSGVNVVAFMQLALGLAPSENAPFVGISSCSPMTFSIDKTKE